MSHGSPRTSVGAPSVAGFRSRRGSPVSLAGSAPVDKEQLAQALDKIHSTASHSDTLTTFNEFASPPPPSTHAESKGIAGDIMQNGLSGIYSRFRGAVGGGKEKASPTAAGKVDPESVDSISVTSQNTATPASRGSLAPAREESGPAASPILLSTASSRLQSPTVSSFVGQASVESPSQTMKSSKASIASTTATTSTMSKSGTSTRPSITPMAKATASSVIVPTVAPVNVSAFKDGDKDIKGLESQHSDPPKSLASAKHENLATFVFDPKGRRTTMSSVGDESTASDNGLGGGSKSLANPQTRPSRLNLGGDGSFEESKKVGVSKTASSALSSLRATDSSRTNTPTRSTFSDSAKRPAAIERIAQSHLPDYQASKTSLTDRSTAETSPIITSAHNSVRHESFAAEEVPPRGYPGRFRIPGTTINEGAPEAVSARLERMRKQVLSKEFWMKDEICKECFSCGDSFSAFRRKHHCRTCGCIFDAKCTSIVAGQRFGVQGSLRVCRNCLDIITRRHDDSSGSEDSGDDSALPSFYHSQQAKYDSSTRLNPNEGTGNDGEEYKASMEGMPRPVATPMMAIPATRRIGDSLNRRSAVLEIDAPQLSRPSSSRSLKALSAAGRPASSGHKRHHSKHNFLGRFKPTVEERAPFQRGITEDLGKQSRLPAFHDDNIIDPDLAPYMSDEESSEEEQPNIHAVMNSGGLASADFESDRSGLGSLLNAGKRYRSRNGEKSVSGISFGSRGPDDIGGSPSMSGFTRPNRRRNLSTASNNLHLSRASLRQPVPGFSNLDEELAIIDNPTANANLTPSRMIRSVSMRDSKAPAIELNNASLHHVRRLLHQLLEDASIPNVTAWEKALVPILLKCTDDVNPNVRYGESIDIRHYVKLKKIPGGKPGDTVYVSGIVFSKNLALKSMPRSISNPRIVIVSFPIEYSRHHNHFMSLEPVIAQEKEFLRNMVNRIASLRPQLLLVQKHVSGLALQYLEEANIAVVSNVKQSVIEAASRFAQTEIISSIDMVVLNPVHIGKSAGFDVKTYVHKDIPGRKKSYIYLSGCPKELGCTIALRGADMATLAKMKTIAEFMVFVVYNLKLETCLMRDEFVLIPSIAENSRNTSPTRHQDMHSIDPDQVLAAASDKLQAGLEAGNIELANASSDEVMRQPSSASDTSGATVAQPLYGSKSETSVDKSNYVSAHASHVHSSHEDQILEDVPIPTFYSDMVAKHQTKILSASPFVKFAQPYLLMKSRQQEQRLSYLKRLRDQDIFEEQTDTEKSKPQKFQLIKPEMVHETIKRAPRQIMEVLHAVHDAEYDKALHNYQTQKRQWETYIQSNLNLFDPHAHQNITVLYTVVCTVTSIPCAGPDLETLVFYNQITEIDADCTLGQYVEDLCLTVNTVCTSNGCERRMSEHHRTYVHGEARITVFVEKSPCKVKGLQDSVLMWSYCKICQKETQVMPMSESTWKYSLGKYLELSFWSSELRLRAGFCPHDLHRDHLRYFGYRNVAIRIHYDPIDLLEIVVPRTRITWKVDNDLKLKNDLFTKSEERWNRFMASVLSRIKGINIDSVAPEKTEACKAEVERLMKRAQEEHASLIRKLQEKYMESKYYEIIPLNRAVRAMQEKVAEWDDAFAEFDANFFPSEKDIRRLAALQLKKMFIDRDESSTSIAAETADASIDADEKSPSTPMQLMRNPSNVSVEKAHEVLASVVEENPTMPDALPAEGQITLDALLSPPEVLDLDREGINHLDLAVPTSSTISEPLAAENTLSSDPSPAEDYTASANAVTEAGVSTSPLESTLSERVEKLRKAHSNSSGESSISLETSGIPRPSERGSSRRSGTAISPPMNRTQSQPAGTLRRLTVGNRSSTKNAENSVTGESSAPSSDSIKPPTTERIKPAEKKLSERLVLGTIKVHRKVGHSLIPRSVNSKRKETKVSALAKHFEQLSREFEKERMRDRKQRAAKVTQSRAFPKASSKPIVEVYKDVNEAVEEKESSEDEMSDVEPTHPDTEPTSVVGGLADLNTKTYTTEPRSDSPTNTAVTADDGATETEDNQQNASQAGSDDDGAASDVDNAILDDIIPGIAEIADSLGAGKPNADIPSEIPKHEKSSLMKILTNFWAERSASGWTPLEYPVNAGDHIFADVDVIVREDEPSSLIAFTLATPDYNNRLKYHHETSAKGDQQPPTEQNNMVDICEDGLDQTEVETSLLQTTGTHLSYSFSDGSAQMRCKVFFAEQFDAVRRKCGVSDRIIESLSRCLKWDSKGGKTKSVFLKTLDDRLVLKSLSPIETAAFLKFAPAYFDIMAQALFHDLPTVIAKMLGFYQIVIKNPVTGTEIKWDVLVMENLFYDRSPTRIFDLKGSMRNRKVQSTGEQNEVLLDENMVEYIYESPLFAREHSKKLLRSAIFNDTLFLQRNDVMDYSLMVAVDEARKELVVGIIDVVRTYTWDKKLESWIKDRGFAGGGRNRPTVTSPKEYKNRFREAMNSYILQAPNSWYQWSGPQFYMKPEKEMKPEPKTNRRQTE